MEDLGLCVLPLCDEIALIDFLFEVDPITINKDAISCTVVCSSLRH